MNTHIEGLTNSRPSPWQRCLSIPLQRISRDIFVTDERRILYARPEEIRYREPVHEITVRIATSGDWEKLYRMRPVLKKLFVRLRKNHLPVIIAVFRNTIIGHSCVEFQPEYPFYRFIALRPAEAWSHDSYILPFFRGKGILSMMYACKAELLTNWGIRKVYVDVPAGNLSSILAHEKLGFKEINRMIYTKFFFCEQLRFTFPRGDHFPWELKTG